MEYQEYEYCKDVGCPLLKNNKCKETDVDCPFTAIQYHSWLKDNGYQITRNLKQHTDAISTDNCKVTV